MRSLTEVRSFDDRGTLISIEDRAIEGGICRIHNKCGVHRCEFWYFDPRSYVSCGNASALENNGINTYLVRFPST